MEETGKIDTTNTEIHAHSPERTKIILQNRHKKFSSWTTLSTRIYLIPKSSYWEILLTY